MAQINPLVAAIKGGSAPKMVKQAAAAGKLPLPPDVLLEVQVLLSNDPDKEIADLSKKSMSEYKVEDIIPIIELKNLTPEVLDFCAHFFIEQPKIIEKIILNPNTNRKTFEYLAPIVSQHLAELIINNQVLLIEHPSILNTLRGNTNLSPGNLKRLDEIEKDFLLDTKKKSETKHETKDSAESVYLTNTKTAPSPNVEVPTKEDQFLNKITTETERTLEKEMETKEEELTLYQKISRMSVSEKIKHALMGSREERALLIRDSNRLVATTVLSSSKLTESEVEAFSQMRNVNEEVLRIIGTNREWAKNYKIALNLIKNPKTPIAVSIPLINRLTSTDLRIIMKDRMVPEAIRIHARRLIMKRQR